MRNLVKRIKAWFYSLVAKAVRQELDTLFRKEGDVCVDHHLKEDSWAVIKVDANETCYLKFMRLGKKDLRDLQAYLKRFERSRVDSTPEVMRHFNDNFIFDLY